jgi:SagB-type dehydrogenase family enzyme
MSLANSIRERRSALQFLREPMQLAHLSFVLEMAHGNSALTRCRGVDLHVVVHRVADIAPGHYRYDQATHRLELIEQRGLEGAMVRACLSQGKAGDAAAGAVMVAQLGEAGALARTRGYRDLLLEAGAMGERIYLAAESLGITARNLAAYRDGAFNDLLKLDGRSEAAIHLTLLGPGS